LDNVTSVGGHLLIGGYTHGVSGNNSLMNLTGLEGLTAIEGNFVMSDNFALTSLTGLENVTSVGGDLRLGNNYALTSLTGLENVTSVGEDLQIHRNYVLTNLTGLGNLTSIGGELSIHYNDSLTSLKGLDKIAPNTITDLIIHANYSLSTCHIESVCAYLASPNGEIEIHDNAIGCNSPEEVQDSCEAHAGLMNEYYMLQECIAAPNPFSTSTTLSYSLTESSTITISIFNPQGQLIEMIEQVQPKGKQQMQWNAEGLPAGMYYFRIQAGDKVGRGKMIKME